MYIFHLHCGCWYLCMICINVSVCPVEHTKELYDTVVRIWRLLCLSVVVLATFAVCWFPFLSSKELTFQVVHRMFPFARGLFEVCESCQMYHLEILFRVFYWFFWIVCFYTVWFSYSYSTLFALTAPVLQQCYCAFYIVAVLVHLNRFRASCGIVLFGYSCMNA